MSYDPSWEASSTETLEEPDCQGIGEYSAGNGGY